MADMNEILQGSQAQENDSTSKKLNDFTSGLVNSIRAMILAIFWLVVVFAVVTAAFVAVRIIILAARHITEAVGL